MVCCIYIQQSIENILCGDKGLLCSKTTHIKSPTMRILVGLLSRKNSSWNPHCLIFFSREVCNKGYESESWDNRFNTYTTIEQLCMFRLLLPKDTVIRRSSAIWKHESLLWFQSYSNALCNLFLPCSPLSGSSPCTSRLLTEGCPSATPSTSTFVVAIPWTVMAAGSTEQR